MSHGPKSKAPKLGTTWYIMSNKCTIRDIFTIVTELKVISKTTKVKKLFQKDKY